MFDELDLTSLRTRGRAAAPVEVSFVRDIRESDLALLGESRNSRAPAIKQLRDRHHQLARCIAQGMRDGEASAVTGYDPSRISILKSDPAFKELVAHYSCVEDSLLADFTQRATTMTLSAMNEIQERIESDPESIPLNTLLEITKTGADRIGHAPVQKSVSINANVELGSRMAAARARVNKLAPVQPVVVAEVVELSDFRVLSETSSSVGGPAGAEP